MQTARATLVRSELLRRIPSLSEDEDVLVQAIDTLVNNGIKSEDDFRFVHPEDLTMLLPIDARKLLQCWKEGVTKPVEPMSSPRTVEQSQSPMQVNIADQSKSVSRENSPVTFNPNWFRSYDIPWDSMPKPLMHCFKQGTRPAPSLRRDMIQILITDIMKIRQRPVKVHLEHIASRIVYKYPVSLQDKIDGRVVGTGYDSFLKQLSARVENQNRSRTSVKKRVLVSTSSCSDPPAKRRLTDSYGCINYDPVDFPEGEDEATLLLRKEMMKASVNSDGAIDVRNVEDNMSKTYILQRQDIISGMPITELKFEWPLLFTEIGMLVNAKDLMGVDIKTTLTDAFGSKGRRVLKYMYTQLKTDLTKLVIDVEVARQQLGNNLPELPGIILLLMAHFSEKSDILMVCVESSSSHSEVEKLDLPSTPILIACGDSLLTASRYMLAIDGCVVNDEIKSFLTGLSTLFASYFCFNIHYPAGAAATMEFIQRYCSGLEPNSYLMNIQTMAEDTSLWKTVWLDI